jgi:hypothetical protein
MGPLKSLKDMWNVYREFLIMPKGMKEISVIFLGTSERLLQIQ